MRDTYGKVISDRLGKYELEDDVIEYRQQMEVDVINNIHGVIDSAKQSAIYQNKDFYVVLLMKVERIGQSPRTYVFARRSCPTPTYNQSVWKYHHQVGTLEFLYNIPDKILYYHIINNSQKYLNDPECRDLARFVVLMESGELLEWVKKENGEKIDAIIYNNEEIACQKTNLIL